MRTVKIEALRADYSFHVRAESPFIRGNGFNWMRSGAKAENNKRKAQKTQFCLLFLSKCCTVEFDIFNKTAIETQMRWAFAFCSVCASTEGKAMTEKELKRLSRKQLLELLLRQTQRTEELERLLEESEARLRARLRIEAEAGSIADAALRLSGVFEAAQEAADRYLDAVKHRCAAEGADETKTEEDGDRPVGTENDEIS